MDGDTGLLLMASAAIILGTGFFVATEYALVGARRSRAEALAKKGSPAAKVLLGAMDHLSENVAGIQIAITMFGIGVGTLTEPFLDRLLSGWLGRHVDRSVSLVLSFLLATFLLVVVGELVPKYVALRDPDRAALIVVRPLRFLVFVLKPLVWLAQTSATAILKPFHFDMAKLGSESVRKDELLHLVRTGSDEGSLDEAQAEFVTRALKLDALSADDIMVHRLDVKWLDLSTTRDEVLARLAEIPYSRIPVCRGDIDDVAGIAYLHDVVKQLADESFALETILRPVVAIPENLSLDKIVARMREERCQMLVVLDEYGGTSGIITLEDVVEEVFGELEDSLEGDRPPVEVLANGRVSARADVRFDELVAKLGIELPTEPSTDTLAEIVVNSLERVPKMGDLVQTEVGVLRVENMARRRITRVSIRRSDVSDSATGTKGPVLQ